ncbi:unnamed protein product [Rotaria sp. Silwood2]|nr:unnamed protein product [Rotaria sp. Silwood2]CAF2926874.1 unnamed protein product [Rotaria sp. Silwood2]CAF3929199.1 unnamed protein product [Rotaria sp. Silwood2]CAF3939158.1 unnamed protein product [Rotaria sp. Silwood2]
MSFQLLHGSFTIPKVKRDSTHTTTSSTNYPAIVITKADILRIIYKLTILFIGDSSIRTLFRDFIKLLSNNHLLENTEVAIQYGNYKDDRLHFCESSSTILIYIHLAIVYGESPIESINYLQTITDCTYIHATIFSSYHGNLNFIKLSKNESSFENLLENYNDDLNKICIHLIEMYGSKRDHHQQHIYMGPYPPYITLIDEEQNQIINNTDEIVGKHGFHTFNQHSLKASQDSSTKVKWSNSTLSTERYNPMNRITRKVFL